MPDNTDARGEKSGRRPQSTIYDVARLSGVSPSTVSRALNKPGRLNANTEQRIREIADAIDYRLNPMARALPTGRTQMLGFILSDITNPVYFELVRGVERVATAQNFTLVLAESQESADVELHAAQRMLASVDGLILVSSRLANEQIHALTARKPLVVVNRRVSGVASVVPNVAPGIRTALRHLAADGHRTIAFAGGPTSSWMRRLRARTLKTETRALGLSLTDVGPGAPTTVGGAEMLPAVLKSGATAVFAYNDLTAIGLLKASGAHGIQIPQDLSLIGFDDIFGSDFTSPPITTIRTPLGSLGETAASALIHELNNGAASPMKSLETELVLRESTDKVTDSQTAATGAAI